MLKMTYHQVAIEANKLVIRLALSKTPLAYIYNWTLYIEYLRSCGWNHLDFDREMLKDIDANWEQKPMLSSQLLN